MHQFEQATIEIIGDLLLITFLGLARVLLSSKPSGACLAGHAAAVT